MQRTLKSLCALALLTGVLAACGTSGTAQAPTPSLASTPSTSPGTGSSTPRSTSPTITISTSLMFTSRPVTAGAPVTVKNLSSVQHTVSADTTAGGFDVTVDAGQTTTFRAPDRPGAYGFHCNIHTFMKGTLHVT